MTSFAPTFSGLHRPSLARRLAVRALHAASRWLDARAYALEFPAERVEVRVGDSQVEVARIPDTGMTALYVDGERRFTFLQGLETL
jgi:hypothetical protein